MGIVVYKDSSHICKLLVGRQFVRTHKSVWKWMRISKIKFSAVMKRTENFDSINNFLKKVNIRTSRILSILQFLHYPIQQVFIWSTAEVWQHKKNIST